MAKILKTTSQLRFYICHMSVGDNLFFYISQLLRDSFSVSQQPPIWEPPSHYSMISDNQAALLTCVEVSHQDHFPVKSRCPMLIVIIFQTLPTCLFCQMLVQSQWYVPYPHTIKQLRSFRCFVIIMFRLFPPLTVLYLPFKLNCVWWVPQG